MSNAIDQELNTDCIRQQNYVSRIPISGRKMLKVQLTLKIQGNAVSERLICKIGIQTFELNCVIDKIDSPERKPRRNINAENLHMHSDSHALSTATLNIFLYLEIRDSQNLAKLRLGAQLI